MGILSKAYPLKNLSRSLLCPYTNESVRGGQNALAMGNMGVELTVHK